MSGCQYRTLFEEIDDVILVANAEGRYLDANPAATRLLGYSCEEFPGLEIKDVVADSQDWTIEEYERFKSEESWQGELELRRKDGRLVPVEAHAIVLPTTPEPMYVSVIRDISERRAAERMQQEFLSMITHDLRTPLTSIRGFAQLMQRQQAYRESAVRQITAQVDQLQRLIADLADVTRIQAGELEVQRAPIDLLSVARIAVGASKTLTNRHQIFLETPDDPVIGCWDSVRITQVLQNLLANAIKYSPDGGEVRLRVTLEHDEALVSVEDQGIGIDPDDLGHLFAPFFRSELAGNTATGLGLGLAISKAVVDSHGGRIWVESTPGHGSTFFFTLPLAELDCG